MSAVETIRLLALVGVGLPAALLALLGLPMMLGRQWPEKVTGRVTGLLTGLSAAAYAGALYVSLAGAAPRVVVTMGDWFAAGETSFAIDLLLDPMSLTFALATAAIGGMVAAFSHRYLHREEGYQRYFLLYATFLTGMQLVVLAGTIEVLFAGWELIGLSSALLVGFFHERPAPVRNALRVLVVYRMSDAAMLSAAILVHHLEGRASLALLFGRGAAGSEAAVSAGEATAIGLLLTVAAAGKCAQLPFSGWLPRAMEGPTPSSAVYYGALSVHAGAYLLLRASPILERSPLVCVLVGLMGACTAVYAALARRVQTDVKSALAFASLTHVSLILVEIALGLHRLAFVHLLGNACLRLFQFLRAPSVLHDFHEARNALGAPHGGVRPRRRRPHRLNLWLYRLWLERGYVEDLLDRLVVGPFLGLARAIDRTEKRIADRIAGSVRVMRPRGDTTGRRGASHG
ncbi:MAG TPA: proton-conducting transporter membrane subunit [Candidatus Polarisedimenticolia bacterium]|nr:proton-conducting transporter membrane subunit [Candidatus Polarisedimenticolia bacterium]